MFHEVSAFPKGVSTTTSWSHPCV